MKIIFFSFINIFIFVTISFAQINNFEKNSIEEIKVERIKDNKTHVFIFIDQKNKDENTEELISELNLREKDSIDFDKFNIYQYNIHGSICTIDHILLDGYDSLPPINLNKKTNFLILIHGKNISNELIGMNCKYFQNKNGEKSPFFDYDRGIKEFIKYISKPASPAQRLIDTLITHKNPTLEHYFALLSSLPLINGLSGTDGSYTTGSTSNISASMHYFQYGKYFADSTFALGIGIEAGFSRNTFSLDASDKIIDSIPYSMDVDGDSYTRVIYADHIREKIAVNTIDLTPHLSLKYQASSDKKWFIAFHPGLKIKAVLSAQYSVTNGSISYGGLYPQYNRNDTMFSGLYDYYQAVPVNTQNQTLLVNNIMLSLSLPLGFYYQFGTDKQWSAFMNVFYEMGLTDLLQIKAQDKVVSTKPGVYNSLLYRNQSLYNNIMGLKIGLSYKF